MKRACLNQAVENLTIANNQLIEGLVSDCEYLLNVVDIVNRLDFKELLAELNEEQQACEAILRQERPDLYTKGE